LIHPYVVGGSPSLQTSVVRCKEWIPTPGRRETSGGRDAVRSFPALTEKDVDSA
jgi:hypothetical protein